MREKYKTNPDKVKEYSRSYHKLNREHKVAYNKKYHKAKSDIVLNAYGKICICCGEQNPLFLTIDHINNDGAAQRLSVGEGVTFYNWLIKNNFPNTLQCLCFNCNCGRYRNKGIFIDLMPGNRK